MSTQSFAEFLGPLPGRVAAIFKAAANRATAEPEELSAGAGIGLFALVWSGRSSLITRNLIGGSALLPQAIASELGERMKLSAKATTLTHSQAGTAVSYQQEGESRKLEARHVVMAVPPPAAAALLREIAGPTAERLDGIRYGPFVSMAIRTRETRPMPWDDAYAIATPGRSFSMFFNHAQVLRSGPRKDGGSLMVYAGGHDASDLLNCTDDEIEAHFTPDLESLYPDLGSIIVETRVARFPVGNTFGFVGRRGVLPLAEPIGERRNIHLAGDYFGELGSMEKAAKSGLEAARRIEI
jgi:oxygen-dependent protoporphyrinogen oxidase